MEESDPSLVHPHRPGAVDALPEHASDRCRLGSVVGAVPVCLERGTEAGDGVGIRRHFSFLGSTKKFAAINYFDQ